MSTPEQSLTEQDKADLKDMYAEPSGGPEAEEPEFHPVLEVWQQVLKPAADEASKPVTPAFANRICNEYREIPFRDMNFFRDLFYSHIMELAHILDLEIAHDPDCLTYRTPEEDVEHNSTHYRQLLMDWQKAILSWELTWDCTSDTAAVEIAALSEVHKMFFGPTGLTAYLDNIKFEYTEADQLQLLEVLNELKESGVNGE